MDTEVLIAQASGWLNSNEGTHQVEVMLDLPEVGWVELKSLRDEGGLLHIVYRGLGLSKYLGGDVELLCDRPAVKAVRRCEATVIDSVFKAAS